MKIVYLQHKDSSVFNYRFDRPLGSLGAKKRRMLLKKNEEITLDELGKRWKKNADIVVIKYIDHRHTLDVLYTMRNEAGFKVVIDIDDNIWQAPVLVSSDINRHANRILMLTESVKCADYVTVSTEPLKTALEPLNPNIAVLKNYIEPSEWTFKRKAHKKTRIGWVWSPTHLPDVSEVSDALREIAKRDDVEIVVFGTDKDIFDFKTTNIPAVKYTEYPKVFMEAGIDISIAPLADNEWNKCKSNIKWLESTMAGAAFVGSRVYPYEFSIKEGKTGYLAKGKNQWMKRLNYLLDKPEKRAELVANAKKVVLEKYADNHEFAEFYGNICPERSR